MHDTVGKCHICRLCDFFLGLKGEAKLNLQFSMMYDMRLTMKKMFHLKTPKTLKAIIFIKRWNNDALI
jgi:hypothetical protein